MDILEERIKVLKEKYSKVWYLADGIYSMYGDKMPVKEIFYLLNKYEQFHVYVDDAHGMSCYGKNGMGYVLSSMPHHSKMVVTTSLGKGYGAGGAVVICNDKKMRDLVSACATPMIFTSPVCPATLGAIVESAKIHLSDEIILLQEKLKERIQLFNKLAESFELPFINAKDTSLAFLPTGPVDLSREICYSLMEEGYFLSISHFPAVPLNNSGIRATITLHSSLEEINAMLKSLKDIYFRSLRRRSTTSAEILKLYKVEKLLVA